MSFDQREFRDAVARFPTGVAVVTARDDQGELLGVTVNSVTSVSLQPALMSFSLGKHLHSLQKFIDVQHFAINVLREDQHAISTRFATAGSDKWAAVSPDVGVFGCPIIRPNVAAFECERYACYEGGDHLIFIGRVLRLETADHGEPLVFYRSRYHRVSRPVNGCSGKPEAGGRNPSADGPPRFVHQEETVDVNQDR